MPGTIGFTTAFAPVPGSICPYSGATCDRHCPWQSLAAAYNSPQRQRHPVDALVGGDTSENQGAGGRSASRVGCQNAALGGIGKLAQFVRFVHVAHALLKL